MELKSYITFFISDQNINTGREMHDIKRALDNYMNYKAPKGDSIASHGLPPSKVFMSTAEAFGSVQQSAQGARHLGGID